MNWFQVSGIYLFQPPGLAMMIILAFSLDLSLGDPRWLLHPVEIIGSAITLLEKVLRRVTRSPVRERLGGLLLAVVVIFSTFFVSREIILLFHRWNAYLGFLTATYLLYTTFSLRSLLEHVLGVETPLKKGDLQGSREALSLIVGRDTEQLHEEEICRGALESLAENTSDGVIAPLFYAFIGGPPLAMAYKAVNTLDSMLGYRNEKYLYFGWAAARLDDLANYLPARLTAVFFLAAGLIGRKISFKQAGKYWLLLLPEGKKHPSPNSGYPEAAAALLLNVRLGGTSYYQGIPSNRPVINAAGRKPSGEDLKFLRVMVIRASFLFLTVGTLLFLIISFFLKYGN
jgi:adenosylcobinamide-phosphate synthase